MLASLYDTINKYKDYISVILDLKLTPKNKLLDFHFILVNNQDTNIFLDVYTVEHSLHSNLPVQTYEITLILNTNVPLLKAVHKYPMPDITNNRRIDLSRQELGLLCEISNILSYKTSIKESILSNTKYLSDILAICKVHKVKYNNQYFYLYNDCISNNISPLTIISNYANTVIKPDSKLYKQIVAKYAI